VLRKSSVATALPPVEPRTLICATPPLLDENPSPEILDVEGVAALLGVDPSYVHEKTRARCLNPLPSHSIGRYLRFFRSEVLAWVAAQPTTRPKRKYRLSPAGRKKLQQRNRDRVGRAA
jgi:predicted DNA-binding transcriptional regulator AlpA